jgi:trehalose 6-phosphate synthase/phosphatase
MSQVIIVSNRLPISVKKEDGKLRFSPSIGGFAAPLAAYVANSKNHWIGWPGIASDELTANDKQTIVKELAKHNCSPVFLSQRQVDDFYSGYSNTVLWPLFHNLARGRNTAGEQRERWWNAYRSVNRQYAEAAMTTADSGSHIWIHDYQLLLVPGILRAERPDSITGFFLHIPFPDVKTFSRLPEHRKLLTGVLGADVIGFHTPGYIANFLNNSQAAGIPTDENNRTVVLPGHIARVDDFPMGIDYEKYANASKSKAVKNAMRKYRKRYKGLRVIVAVDRLDPIKGLVERLEAYGTLLKLHPEMHGKIVFSMVAAPSRIDVAAYKNLSKRLGLLVGEINTVYGTPDWQPVDYMNESMPFEDVTALFRIADIAFIAPIRDGMNLAAKEFVASKRKAGVLILSQTAGAAQELPDAILVNPRRRDELVAALEQALKMRKRELKRRLRRMQQHLSVNTVQNWTQNFIDNLQQPIPRTPAITHSLKGKLQFGVLEDYRHTKKRLLLLDYDGSLVPFTEDYKNSKPPKSLIQLLETISANTLNEVVLISGRGPQDLESWFGELPISLVAEHGAAVKKAGGKSWHTIEKVDTKWKKQVMPILEKYAAKTPGARVETKPHSLVWHYRAASPYYAQKNGVAIKRLMKPLLRTYGLELLQGNKVMEVKNPLVGKGNAAERWLKHDYDFILAIGDDMTDEDLFAALPPHGYSVKVGRGRTLAKYRLAGHKDALALLKKFI